MRRLFFFCARSYLIWSASGDSVGGLYRVDLADLTDQPLAADKETETGPQIQRILQNVRVGVFKVDYSNCRLLVINPGNESVLAVSLNK